MFGTTDLLPLCVLLLSNDLTLFPPLVQDGHELQTTSSNGMTDAVGFLGRSGFTCSSSVWICNKQAAEFWYYSFLSSCWHERNRATKQKRRWARSRPHAASIWSRTNLLLIWSSRWQTCWHHYGEVWGEVWSRCELMFVFNVWRCKTWCECISCTDFISTVVLLKTYCRHWADKEVSSHDTGKET